MAGDAVVGALRVVLGADTADLDKGLKSSQSNIAAFGSAVGGAMAAAAAAVVTAGAAIGVTVKKFIDDFDTLAKTSQKIGVPVEQLSALAYAADLSDVSFEQLSKGVGKLNKAMVEAAAKPTSEAANAFRALGVSATDSGGKLKSSQTVMEEIAGKFEGIKDGAGKTAVAMALFGKAGADLIPLLNGGRDGLKEMADEAAQFGAVVSTKSAKEAENFNDNLTRLGYAVKGVFVQSTSQLLPILVDISNKMVEAAKNSSALELVVTALTASMKGLVTAGVLIGATFQVVGDLLSIVWGGLAKVIKGDLSGAFENMKVKTADIASVATSTMATLNNVWSGAKAGAEGAAASTDKATKSQKEFNFAAMGGKNALDSFLESQAKRTAAQNAEAASIGKGVGELERLRIAKQADEILDQNKIARSPAVIASITAAGDAAAAAALKIQAANISQMVMSPAEKYAQDLAQLTTTYEKTSMTAETFAARQQQLAEGVGATWEQATAGMASGFSQLATQFGKSSSDMAVAAKVFGIIEATINTYTAFTKALASAPPPFNYVMAAGVLAAGMAKVAAIKSQSIPTGYATGGFVTGAGTATSDSIPAMLSDGEFVMNAAATSQHRAELEAMNSGRGRSPSVVNLSMPIATTREALRDLIEGLNGMFTDGYQLKVQPV